MILKQFICIGTVGIHINRNYAVVIFTCSVPICDLSINRLRTVQPSGHPSWDTILRSLAISSYSSPETVLSKLLETKEKGMYLEWRLPPTLLALLTPFLSMGAKASEWDC